MSVVVPYMLCTESNSFKISNSLLTSQINKNNCGVSDTSVDSLSAMLNKMNHWALLLISEFQLLPLSSIPQITMLAERLILLKVSIFSEQISLTAWIMHSLIILPLVHDFPLFANICEIQKLAF